MRTLTLLAGSILLILGMISMVTPIPGGTLAITVGAGMIICASETVANWLKKKRTINLRLNRVIGWLEDKMGERLSAPLRNTRPD